MYSKNNVDLDVMHYVDVIFHALYFDKHVILHS